MLEPRVDATTEIPPFLISEPQGAEGKPLLLLGHSLGTDARVWDDVIPLLHNDYRISLLTLPGHGLSEVPFERFTLAALAEGVAKAAASLSGSGRFYFAGVSISGALALELALHHPDRVLGAAVIAAGAELGSPEHWAARAAIVREQSPAVLVEASRKLWFDEHALKERVEAVDQLLFALANTSSEGYARCAEALEAFDVRGRLADIEVPLLALWGEKDSVGTEQRQDEIVSGAKHVLKVMIADCAHQPPVEQPEATADALLEFFSRVG